MTARYRAPCRAMSKMVFLAAVLWLAPACSGWLRPFHPTALDALTEFPGYLSKADLASVQVLQEREIAGGLAILYRHADRDARLGGE